MSARHTALTALIACRQAGAWSDSVLDARIRQSGLDSRDAALATRLCYGVLQNRLLLDFDLAAFCKRKLADLQPVVLDILRLGAYQILFLDKIPVSAAVNEAVEQAKKSANRQAAGLVNGVLRALARGPVPEVPGDDRLNWLSVTYSHPRALVELLEKNVPAEALEPLLQANNQVPDTAVMVNTRRTTASELQARLEGGQLHPWLPDCLTLSRMGDPEKLDAFCQGLFWVQDPAARLAVLALNLKPGMRVLDACAAPGGKTFAAAVDMEGRGRITACDLHENKLKRVAEGAHRLGFDNVTTQLADATKPDERLTQAFDAVLLDVPCSGLGVIRKKPDIRYKDLETLQGLPRVQAEILEQRCTAVKKGGLLLYATCTILKRENEDTVRGFLAKHPEFTPEPIAVPGVALPENDGMLTLYPGQARNTDGFFLCRLRRAL